MTADSGTRAFTIINPAPVRRISEASAAPIVSGAASNASRTGWIASAGGLAIECLSWEEAARRTEAWRTLAAQALEANIFNEPDFALSAAQHLPQAIRPMFLFVSQIETGGISGLPVAIFALEQPRGTGIFIDRLWCPPEMPVATPLIHPEYGFAALDLLQEWLAREFPLMNGVVLTGLPVSGPFAVLVQSHSQARNLQTCQFDLRSRAVLSVGPDSEKRVTEWIGRKRTKEMRRLSRRLSEKGALEFASARSRADAKSAAEQFLALEARGWKGRNQTALLSDPSLSTFLRTMSRRLSSRDSIEIDTLSVGGEALAIGIVLRSGDEAFFWKTAYNEDFAQYSPGVLLTLRMTARLLNDPAVRFVNSYAIPNHPMIDRIWPDRIGMMDLMIAIRGRSESRYVATATVEGTRRKVRALAKRAYHSFKRQAA